jgi:signal transduction histidine kinase
MKILSTLRSQSIAVVAAAVIVSNLAVAITLEIAREGELRGARVAFVVDRVSALFDLVSTLSPAQRERALTVVNNRFFRFEIDQTPPFADHVMTDDEKQWGKLVADAETAGEKGQVLVHVSEGTRAARTSDGRPATDADQRVGIVDIAQVTDSGDWLVTRTYSPQVPPLPTDLIIAACLATILTCAAAAWLSNRVSRPLAELAAASDHVARGANAPHLTPRGPEDLKRAAIAFNAMSDRVTRTLESQRQLLSAVGHDLRTPLAAIRITAEFVSDRDIRSRLTRNLDELQSLTEAVLSAARAGLGEEMRRVDLASLIESVCDDLIDLGYPVQIDIAGQAPCLCRPNDIRRAVRNLVENAVRYGGSALVSLKTETQIYLVTVEDNGPGIDETRLEEVFEPFVRLEASRSNATGGTGLGLTLARAVAREHGGDIMLSNRKSGGLCASLRLPRQQ